MFRKLSKRAQTTAEYAILIAIVVGAVVAMQIYVKRGIQGRVRNVVDYVENPEAAKGVSATFNGEQYEPYYATSEMTSSRKTAITDEAQAGGAGKKTITGDTSARTGTQTTDLGRATND